MLCGTLHPLEKVSCQSVGGKWSYNIAQQQPTTNALHKCMPRPATQSQVYVAVRHTDRRLQCHLQQQSRLLAVNICAEYPVIAYRHVVYTEGLMKYP